MLTNPRTADLEDATAPEDVITILRNAAEKYRESHGELQSAWQDKKAGVAWAKIANELDKLAKRISEKVDLS